MGLKTPQAGRRWPASSGDAHGEHRLDRCGDRIRQDRQKSAGEHSPYNPSARDPGHHGVAVRDPENLARPTIRSRHSTDRDDARQHVAARARASSRTALLASRLSTPLVSPSHSQARISRCVAADCGGPDRLDEAARGVGSIGRGAAADRVEEWESLAHGLSPRP